MNILSLSFNRIDNIILPDLIKRIKKIILNEKNNIDIVVFPEYWNQTKTCDKYFLEKLMNDAIFLKIFLAIPIYFKDNGKIYNRFFVISPEGKIVYFYDKINLYYKEKNITPGSFNQKLYWDYKNIRIGFAICFDINLNKLWYEFDKNNINLVIWSSTYIGGKKLESYAGIYHFYILTSTLQEKSTLYDISGYKSSEKSDNFNIFYIPSKEERNIYHFNKNIDIIKDLNNYLCIEKKMENKQWLILSKKGDIDLEKLEKKYSLINLRDYIKFGIV